MIIPRNRSKSADYFKNILWELRFTAREARTASASDTLDVPSFHEGEKPMFFPPRGSPFSLRNRRSSLPPKVGPAAGRRTNARPKRLNGLFYLLDLILNASMGQIRRLGGRKARQKRIFHQTRGFNLLSSRRPCTEFDLT